MVMALVAIFLIWSTTARLDEFAIAEGEVVPEGKVKLVQHLEGGIIREIYVQDGSVVKEGEPLVQLDLAVGSLNREELQVRLDGLVLQRPNLAAPPSHSRPTRPSASPPWSRPRPATTRPAATLWPPPWR
jgi:adhesin transport system membrane fusion protein